MDSAPVVLVLCTGNICRSPIAEGVLRARLRDRGIRATVGSAGLSFDDRPATPEAIAAIAQHGIDISGHRSRIINRQLIASADLVIAMERMHVREAVLVEPSAFERTFTLKELVRRATPRKPGETLHDWLRRVGAGRRPVDLLGSGAIDDVDDPYRRSHGVYVKCATELVTLVDALVASAWPDKTQQEGAA